MVEHPQEVRDQVRMAEHNHNSHEEMAVVVDLQGLVLAEVVDGLAYRTECLLLAVNDEERHSGAEQGQKTKLDEEEKNMSSLVDMLGSRILGAQLVVEAHYA
jgi:hypothetical protein